MEDKIKIRKAVMSDAPIIERIIKTAFEEYSKYLPDIPDALGESVDVIEEDIQTKLVFVAQLNDDTVGTLRLTQKGNSMYLSRFAVRPTAQNTGIGRNLLEYADIISRLNNCNEIYLHTAVEAEHLVNLYTSNDYRLSEITEDRGYKRGKFIKKL